MRTRAEGQRRVGRHKRSTHDRACAHAEIGEGHSRSAELLVTFTFLNEVRKMLSENHFILQVGMKCFYYKGSR